MLKLKASEVVHIIDAAISDRSIVPMIWGAPGVGKTAICNQTAKKRDHNYLQVIVAERESPDFIGHYYRDENNDMRLSRSDIIREIEESDRPTLLHLDEVTQSPMMMQNIVSRIVHDRTLGNRRLRDDTVIVLSGNMRQHKAGTFEMQMHLRNRLAHVEQIADKDDCRNHFAEIGMNHLISAYLEWRPDHLSMFDTTQYANRSEEHTSELQSH